jgi:hypothetical protein
MSTKILGIAIAAACALALVAGPAQASGGNRSTIAFTLKPDLAAAVSCPDSLFGFGLDVASLAGKPLGTGRSCVDSIDGGCDPFTPYCRQTLRATLTLDLARGSLTVPVKLHEVWPTPSSFFQLGSGEVSGGTGAYAAAKGRLAGGGAGAFDDQSNFTGRLVYIADLRGVR